MGQPKKHCSRCSTWKPRAAFDRRAAARDGLDSWCKDCRRAYVRRWIAANRRRHEASLKQYRETHREKLRAYQREYQRRRRGRLRAQKRARKN